MTVQSAPSITGYNFDGWKKGNQITTGFDMPAEDVELRGRFSEQEITIFYKTETPDSTLWYVSPELANNVKVVTGTPQTSTARVRKEGYVFSHWTLEVNGSEVAGYRTTNATVTPSKADDPAARTSNIWTTRTYVAHFEPVKYTVTYSKGEHGILAGQNDDGNVIHTKLAYNDDTPAAPEVTADENYYFTGWDHYS